MATSSVPTAKPLTYGSTVFISYPNDPNLMIFSDGMVKSRIYLKDMNHISERNSFDRSLFKIYPLFINTNKKEALTMKSEIETNGLKNWKQKEVVEDLKAKLTLEYKFNLEHFEKVKNLPVPFEQPIQLFHVVSNKFLAYNFNETEDDQELFKLELVDVPSEMTTFKLIPSYKHQKENDEEVLSKDPVFIVCGNHYMNKTPYVHCDHREEEHKNDKLEEAKSEDKDYMVLLSIDDKVIDGATDLESCMKGGVNVSLEKSNRWAINMFCEDNEEKNLLFYGDVIWMNHAEQNAIMVTKKYEQGRLDVGFVETVFSDHFQQYVGNTNGMWIIENSNYLVGGVVCWDHVIRLKHFSSGQYLTMKYHFFRKEFEVQMDKIKTDESLFQFVQVPNASSSQNNSRYINKEAFAKLMNASTGYWFHVEKIEDRLHASLSKNPLDKDVFKLFKANHNEIWETNFLISCLPILKNYLNFLTKSAKHKGYVHNQVKLDEAEKAAKEAQECLVQLDLFCTNKLFNTLADQKYGEVNNFRQTVLREQYILEMLCELLRLSFSEEEYEQYLERTLERMPLDKSKRRMLSSIMTRQSLKNWNFGTDIILEEKVKVCRLAYKLLKSICQDNPENELCVFKLFHQFQFHVKYLEEAIDCFGAIIEKNEGILNSLSEGITVSLIESSSPEIFTRERIKKNEYNLIFNTNRNKKQETGTYSFLIYFFGVLAARAEKENSRNINYLKFLRKLCTCKGKSVMTNQELLYNVFTHFSALKRSVFIDSAITPNGLKLQFAENVVSSLEKCFHRGVGIVNHKEDVKYFQEQLGFYSDLLVGRNYLWKSLLEENYPLEFVFEQISNEDIPVEIRAAFCDLALTLYIDHEPLNPKVLPSLCRVFKKRQGSTGSSGTLYRKISALEEKVLMIDKKSFLRLLEQVLDMIRNERQRLEHLFRRYNQKSKKRMSGQGYDEDLMSSMLLAKLIELLSKMLKVGLFEIVGKQNLYPDMIKDLICVLEYDHNNPGISYALDELRNDRKARNEVVARNFKANEALGTLVGMIGGLSKEVVGTVKDVASIIGNNDSGKIMKINKTDEGAEHNALVYNNPLMKGMVLLKHQLTQLTSDQTQRNSATQENIIKTEICDLLHTMLDMRQDFLISNILAWYDGLIQKLPCGSPEKKADALEGILEQELSSVLPAIYKTGVARVDAKVQPKQNKEGRCKGLFQSKKNKKARLQFFVNYTGEGDTPDLETLFTGERKSNNKQQPFLGIVPSLFLSFYYTTDTDLEYKLLKLMMRMFNQREELVKNLRRLELIFEKEDVEIYSQIHKWIKDLKGLSEKSEVWLLEYTTVPGSTGKEIRKVIELLKNLQKSFSSAANNQTEYSKSKQSMVRNMDGHKVILDLIRDGMHDLRAAMTDITFSPEKKKLLLELFSLAHSCLFGFCAQNQVNKEILTEHLKLFLSNLDLKMGQTRLISEICRNNKIAFENYSDLVIEGLIKAIDQHGRYPGFLDPILEIQHYGGEVFVENQIKILNYFVPSNRALQENELKILYAGINRQTNEIEFSFKATLPMDRPYAFHEKLFDILVINTKDNENLAFTYPKLYKIFPLNKLLQLLLKHESETEEQKLMRRKRDLNLATDMIMETQKDVTHTDSQKSLIHIEDEQTPLVEGGLLGPKKPESSGLNLKSKVLEIMETLYLSGDKDSANDFLANIEAVETLLVQERTRLQDIGEEDELTEEECIYIFGHLVPFLNRYVAKVLNDNMGDLEDRRDNQLIARYIEHLCTKIISASDYLSLDQINDFKELLNNYVDETNNAGNRVIERVEELVRIKEEKEIRQRRIRPEMLESEPSHEKDFHDIFKHEANDGITEYSSFWQVFLNHFLGSRILSDECEKEKYALSEALWHFQEVFAENQQQQRFIITIERRHLINKLINFLQYGLNNKVDKSTTRSVLQILKKMIDNATNKTDIQNFFDNNDATSVLLSFFSSPKPVDDDLMNEFLSFAISLLEGGNVNIQRTIYNFCIRHPESEAMFAKFHSMICEQIDYLQLKVTIRSGSYKLIELELSHKLKTLIVEKLLRMLQLFTEGHNLDLQNYLRYQTSSRTRYNLVETVTDLLRAYDLNLVQGNYDNVIRCLDTLTEFVQGPCPENQIEIINGKFFEVALGLLTKDDDENKDTIKAKRQSYQKKSRGARRFVSDLQLTNINLRSTDNLPLEPWMLARLKYKIVTLLHSLLEMRSSDTVIVKRIMRSLPLETLKTSLVKIYKNYKAKYGPTLVQKSLNNFDGDPREDNKNSEEYEVIIETAFMMYFLIQSYSNVDMQNEDFELQQELLEIKRAQTALHGSMEDLLRNNVVSELGKFTLTFAMSGIESVHDLKRKLTNRTAKRKKKMDTKNIHAKQKEKENEELLRKAIEFRQLSKEAVEFFMNNSAHIEVVRDDSLERVDFILLPYCKQLPKETKNRFNNKVDRQSLKSKVDDLISNSDQIIEICKHEYRLKSFFNRNKVIAIFANFVNLWKDLAFILSIILNIAIFSSYSVRPENETENGDDGRLTMPLFFRMKDITTEETKDNFLKAGIAMTTCSFFVVIFFLLKQMPLILKQAWKDNPPKKKRTFARSAVIFLMKILKTIFFSLRSFQVLYYIGYGIFSVLGTAIHPFFFAFHLTAIFIRYPTIRDVAKAVWRPKKQLGLTFLLFLILTYIFSLFAFGLLSADFQGDCESTYLCFLTTFDHLFKGQGGIGGYLLAEFPQFSENFRVGRFFYDNLANIILNIIMINIFSGIIIDTFGFLREREQSKQEDIRQKCFICGLSKEVFDRQTDANYTFYTHIKRDHYMWNYVFYLAYLKNKDDTEFTGIESYINDKVINGDHTWFPFHKAIALKHHQEDEEEKHRQIRNTFQREANETKQNIQEISVTYQKLKETIHLKR